MIFSVFIELSFCVYTCLAQLSIGGNKMYQLTRCQHNYRHLLNLKLWNVQTSEIDHMYVCSNYRKGVLCPFLKHTFLKQNRRNFIEHHTSRAHATESLLFCTVEYIPPTRHHTIK